ncbi:MAG: cupin domain-containing protein [Pseudomonadota bacterium]
MSNAEEFFNLDDLTQGIKRQLAPGLDTRIFVGEQSMLSVLTLAPGAQGDHHSHPEEQWGVLLEGSGTRFQGGEAFPVKAGDFWRTPGNIPHGFKAGPDGARVLDIFSPPREAYKKAGTGFAAEK